MPDIGCLSLFGVEQWPQRPFRLRHLNTFTAVSSLCIHTALEHFDPLCIIDRVMSCVVMTLLCLLNPN